jgi:hypothetical protein
MKAKLHVRDIETGKVVDSVEVSTTSSRHVEKVMRGMMINMNRDRYFIDDSEFDGLD